MDYNKSPGPPGPPPSAPPPYAANYGPAPTPVCKSLIPVLIIFILFTSSKQPNLRIRNPQYLVYLLDQQ